MMKGIAVVVFLFLFNLTSAQSLNCKVQINAQQTGRTQLSIFRTLQSSLQDFITQETWGGKRLSQEQNVSCDMFITVHNYSDNRFEASLQIQSSRPVYGTAMTTPIFNYKDNRFSFTYDENQPLRFNPNAYENNLVSVVSFYANVILGLDADSFALDGGRSYFDQADQIANVAMQGGGGGWSSSAGSSSRYELNRQLQSSTLKDFHEALYEYHLKGLDEMSEDIAKGKTHIVEALRLLKKADNTRPNTLLIRSFFDAKANEISDILTDGPHVDLGDTASILQSIAPAYSGLWRGIR